MKSTKTVGGLIAPLAVICVMSLLLTGCDDDETDNTGEDATTAAVTTEASAKSDDKDAAARLAEWTYNPDVDWDTNYSEFFDLYWEVNFTDIFHYDEGPFWDAFYEHFPEIRDENVENWEGLEGTDGWFVADEDWNKEEYEENIAEVAEIVSESGEAAVGSHPEDPFRVDTSVMSDNYYDPDAATYHALFGTNGSCYDITKKTVVLTILLDTTTGSWNMDSEEDRQYMNAELYNLYIGTEWIKEQCARYGYNDSYFYYNWNDYPNLLIQASIAQDNKSFTDVRYDMVNMLYPISARMDKSRILSDYDAQNICFLFLCKQPIDGKEQNVSMSAENYSNSLEFVAMTNFLNGQYNCPANYAHEILHCFGLPDLYYESRKITQAYVDYGIQRQTNDIMRITWNQKSGKYIYDSIDNDFSELDAYYCFLTDKSDDVEKFNLGRRLPNRKSTR